MDKKRGKNTHSRSSLPSDFVVNIAFFIPEWSTVVEYLKALRPLGILGPLEHLYQLHLLNWRPGYRWTRLSLTNMTEPCRVHVESIAKFFPEFRVNDQTDINWCRKFLEPNASIFFMDLNFDDLGIIRKWTPFRITSFYGHLRANQLDAALSCLKFLVTFSWHACSPKTAASVFKYAASSPFLVHLTISCASKCHPITITKSMANDLLQWTTSRSIRHFDVTYFTWEDLNLRKKVIAAASVHESLEELYVRDYQLSNLRFFALFDKFDGKLSVSFAGTEEFVHNNASLEIMRALISPFEALRPKNTRTLFIPLLEVPAFCTVWSTVVPLLQASRFQLLEVSHAVLTLDDVVLLTDGIRDHSTLRALVLFDVVLPFAGAKLLVETAPPSVQNIKIRVFATRLSKSNENAYSDDELRELKTLARQHLIDINYKAA
ncbi:hypothetical protein LEN26_014019 [Aphanomyces euteiches]|nr:hypothetical protein LEN26_014019 [Aphanomyces euteiches]